MAGKNGTDARLKNLEGGQGKMFNKIDKLFEEIVHTREAINKSFSDYQIETEKRIGKIEQALSNVKVRVSIFSTLITGFIGYVFWIVKKVAKF